MEICGGQTHTIVKYGIDELLPPQVELVHGPGCPVCVTPLELIDQATEIAFRPEVTFCSFGDMLRVPGSRCDLFAVKAAGGDVRIVYSPIDCLKIAEQNPQRTVEITDRKWRGIGLIPDSGYRLRPAYSEFDAQQRFAVAGIQVSESKVCISGQILQGLKKPHQCPAFGKACTPQTPLGATMVSSEGACAAYYHYGRYRDAAAVAAPAASAPQIRS